MWQTVSDFFVFLIHQLCLYDNSSSKNAQNNNNSGSGVTNNYNSTGEHFCANLSHNDSVINPINTSPRKNQRHNHCGGSSGPIPGPGPGAEQKSCKATPNDDIYSYSRSIVSQRIDDRSSINLVPGAGGRRRSSSVHGGGSIIGNCRAAGTNSSSNNRDLLNNLNDLRTGSGGSGNGRKESSNCVQAQIERMFNDVAKEQSSGGTTPAAAIVGQNFSVRCLGSLPLKDKVTSLVGLQEPLWQLYLSGAGHGVSRFSIFAKVVTLNNVCPSSVALKLHHAD